MGPTKVKNEEKGPTKHNMKGIDQWCPIEVPC